MTTTTKDRLIFHESGHAVVATAAGIPILCLIQGGDSFGMLQLEPVKAAQLKDERFRNAYTVASVAGSMGESIRFGGGGLHSLNHGLGMTDLKNLTSIGLSLHEILSACYKSEKYLKANWAAVQRVANVLREQPLMLESDVKAAAGNLPDLFEPEPKPESKPVSKNLRQSFKASTKSLWMKHTSAFQSFGG